MRRMLGRLYRGEYSLAVTFWGFFVAGNLVVWLVAALLAAPVLFFVSGSLAYAMILALIFAYWCIVLIGIWRSAGSGRSRPVYQIMPKVLIVLFIANTIWNLVNGEALRQVRLVQEVLTSNEVPR
jgi:hypothetical protein